MNMADISPSSLLTASDDGVPGGFDAAASLAAESPWCGEAQALPAFAGVDDSDAPLDELRISLIWLESALLRTGETHCDCGCDCCCERCEFGCCAADCGEEALLYSGRSVEPEALAPEVLATVAPPPTPPPPPLTLLPLFPMPAPLAPLLSGSPQINADSVSASWPSSKVGRAGVRKLSPSGDFVPTSGETNAESCPCSPMVAETASDCAAAAVSLEAAGCGSGSEAVVETVPETVCFESRSPDESVASADVPTFALLTGGDDVDAARVFSRRWRWRAAAMTFVQWRRLHSGSFSRNSMM
eukprot:comp22193_c0_seq1/m.52309 comp22193_c0_seq1/g.52309  ORF comp22193_c0_seq1/g.52309 comp22193_c0_seq1/m.52309 type:complete len:300 (+) comp22193_c0_seq1:830-1729(+)